MLASLRSAPDGFVMVDSGTAMTIDVVNASGVHQGGYIVPGLKLMRSSLELNTKIQLGAVKHGNYGVLGQSTDDAVFSGTAMMSVSLIEEINQRYPDLPVFLTGGDAEILAKSLRFTCWEIKADLVLNGFGIALAADSL
jgi:type III pantothenate kinase